MFTISPGHYGKGTGASDIIDEVAEAIRVAKQVATNLRKSNVTANYIEDNVNKTQSANIPWLIAQHNKTIRQLDVSIHFNKVGARTDRAFGVEVLHYGDSTKALAANVSKAIATVSGLKNRGAKQRTDLGILKGTNKPCILIEVCFVESTADVALYRKHFESICSAISNVLLTHIGKAPIAPPVATGMSDADKARDIVRKAVKDDVFTSPHSGVASYTDSQLLGYMVTYIERVIK